MSVLKEFKLPDVGEGLTEADIVRWHVKPGDTVVVNQIIVEIETAKAVVELPSPYAGTVASLLVPEGQTADVGTPIISVDTSPAVGDTGGPAEAKPLDGRCAAGGSGAARDQRDGGSGPCAAGRGRGRARDDRQPGAEGGAAGGAGWLRRQARHDHQPGPQDNPGRGGNATRNGSAAAAPPPPVTAAGTASR